MKLFHAGNFQYIASNSGYMRAHCIEHIAQILNMRLACGICNDRFTLRKNRRHNSILRSRYGTFIKKNIRPDKLVCRK